MTGGLRIIDVEQGTDEWLEARRGMITASTVGQLVTPRTIQPAANPESRALVARLAAERITGWADDTYQSADMIRGTLDEPYARDYYAEHFAQVETCGLIVRDFEDGRSVGYSPDGLVGEAGAIEIKAPRAKVHVQTVIADAVPSVHMAQLQTGLYVTGRQWIDFISWCGGLPAFVKRTFPDERWQEAIESATCAAEIAIRETVERYRGAVRGLPATERINHFSEIEVNA